MFGFAAACMQHTCAASARAAAAAACAPQKAAFRIFMDAAMLAVSIFAILGFLGLAAVLGGRIAVLVLGLITVGILLLRRPYRPCPAHARQAY